MGGSVRGIEEGAMNGLGRSRLSVGADLGQGAVEVTSGLR